MATHSAPDPGFSYRQSPPAWQAFEQWQRDHPEARPSHSHPWDVSRSDIYRDDTWGPIFAAMRARAPINKVTGTPFGDYWNVTSHQAVLHVESLPDVFSSSWQYGGITIGDPPRDIDAAVLNERRLPMFIAMDRPEHTGQRRTMTPAFTPGEIVRMESEIRARTAQVLDGLPVGTAFDWVDAVSIELTTGMLAILFGFPWDDRRLLTFWSDWAGDVELTLARGLADERFAILGEMAQYFRRLWAERMGQPPTPDLISMMIHSPAMNHMSPQEFMGNLVLLIVGGNDTTRNTMSGLIHALDQFPDQRTILENEPALIPNAVQEGIRFVTPLAHMRRTATVDFDLLGQHIAAGDKLVMWYISANRDEAVFADPDRLIVGRDNARRHLSFGHGIHRCIGARLAELQLRVLLEEMQARRLRVHVTGPAERVRANFVHGFRRMEVTVERY